jgi:hypothetical protein
VTVVGHPEYGPDQDPGRRALGPRGTPAGSLTINFEVRLPTERSVRHGAGRRIQALRRRAHQGRREGHHDAPRPCRRRSHRLDRRMAPARHSRPANTSAQFRMPSSTLNRPPASASSDRVPSTRTDRRRCQGTLRRAGPPTPSSCPPVNHRPGREHRVRQGALQLRRQLPGLQAGTPVPQVPTTRRRAHGSLS